MGTNTQQENDGIEQTDSTDQKRTHPQRKDQTDAENVPAVRTKGPGNRTRIANTETGRPGQNRNRDREGPESKQGKQTRTEQHKKETVRQDTTRTDRQTGLEHQDRTTKAGPDTGTRTGQTRTGKTNKHQAQGQQHNRNSTGNDITGSTGKHTRTGNRHSNHQAPVEQTGTVASTDRTTQHQTTARTQNRYSTIRQRTPHRPTRQER